VNQTVSAPPLEEAWVTKRVDERKTFDGMMGTNTQVRFELWCMQTSQCIAFFCRNQVPTKTNGYPTRPAREEHNAFVTKTAICHETRNLAEQWLEAMKTRFPLETLDHPL
jgi:hypothetical protein